MRRSAFIAAALGGLWLGCQTPDTTGYPCESNKDCAGTEKCSNGFCGGTPLDQFVDTETSDDGADGQATSDDDSTGDGSSETGESGDTGDGDGDGDGDGTGTGSCGDRVVDAGDLCFEVVTIDNAMNGGGFAMGDLNDDGFADVVFINGNGFTSVHALIHNGRGQFSENELSDGVDTGGLVALGQWNSDADSNVDVMVGAAAFLGNGDGTFGGVPAAIDMGGNGAAAVADFNEDSRSDLAFVNLGIEMLYGNGDGTFSPETYDSSPFSGGWAVEAIDWDGDENLDVATFDGTALTVYRGDGAGNLVTDGTVSSQDGPDAGFGHSIVSGDFDGDGDTDLVVNGANPLNTEYWGLFFMENDAGFFNPTALSVELDTYAGGVVELTAADYNGDGNLDLALAEPTETRLSVITGGGDGTFTKAQSWATPDGGFNSSVADLNGDGVPDFAARSGTAIHVLMSDP